MTRGFWECHFICNMNFFLIVQLFMTFQERTFSPEIHWTLTCSLCVQCWHAHSSRLASLPCTVCNRLSQRHYYALVKRIVSDLQILSPSKMKSLFGVYLKQGSPFPFQISFAGCIHPSFQQQPIFKFFFVGLDPSLIPVALLKNLWPLRPH